MSKNLPEGVNEVPLDQWDQDHERRDSAPSTDDRPGEPASETDMGNEVFVPIEASDSEDDTQRRKKDDDMIGTSEQEFVSENLEDNSTINEKFKKFIKSKQKVVLSLDESRVALLPPQLRQPIQNIITKIKRWAARNPSGSSLSALQILAERLDEFLELQHQRETRDYEAQCRDLLSMIYQNTIEAQRMARKLKEAATPRSLDEYE